MEAFPESEARVFLGPMSMGRFGLPEDIRKVTLFLASAYVDRVTGKTICVDGGQAEKKNHRLQQNLSEANRFYSDRLYPGGEK